MIYGTSDGIKKLRTEAENLEQKLREVEVKIGETTTQSAETFHDNAPYEAVLHEIKLYDKRLCDAHNQLRSCEMKEYPTVIGKTVEYGTKVILKRDSDIETYCLVGMGHSDPDKNRILYISPLARSIMGKSKGDKFHQKIGAFMTTIEIMDVLPIDNLE